MDAATLAAVEEITVLVAVFRVGAETSATGNVWGSVTYTEAKEQGLFASVATIVGWRFASRVRSNFVLSCSYNLVFTHFAISSSSSHHHFVDVGILFLSFEIRAFL